MVVAKLAHLGVDRGRRICKPPLSIYCGFQLTSVAPRRQRHSLCSWCFSHAITKRHSPQASQRASARSWRRLQILTIWLGIVSSSRSFGRRFVPSGAKSPELRRKVNKAETLLKFTVPPIGLCAVLLVPFVLFSFCKREKRAFRPEFV